MPERAAPHIVSTFAAAEVVARQSVPSMIISTWSSAGWLWLAAMNLQKGYRDSPRPSVRARSRRTVGDLIKKNRRVYKPRPVGEHGPSTPYTGRAGKSLPWL